MIESTKRISPNDPRALAVTTGVLDTSLAPEMPEGLRSGPERPWLKSPDRLTTLDEFGELLKSEPGVARKLIERCSGYLGYLQFHFSVFPVGAFPQRFPESYAEFFKALTPKAREEEYVMKRFYSRILVEALSEELHHYRQRTCEPATWTREMMPTLRDRIVFETLRRDGLFERSHYMRADIARVFEEYEPRRADFIEYSHYAPDEFPGIVKRFGWVAVLNSLPVEDPLRIEAEEEIGALGDILATYPAKLRLNPRAVLAHDKEVFAAAKDLFGRLSWAVSDLAPVEVDPIVVRREAFRAFISAGREGALEVLKEWRTHAAVRGKILDDFARNWSSYSGSGSNITTSAFEREVVKLIKARGFFVRTQVPYRELCNTERKFVADMVLAIDSPAPVVLESTEGRLLIIEVSSLGDDFVHGEEYQKRMHEKKALATGAGILFVELTELDPWRDFIDSLRGRCEIPGGAFRWLDEQSRSLGPVTSGEQLRKDTDQGPTWRYPFWERDPGLQHFIARRAS